MLGKIEGRRRRGRQRIRWLDGITNSLDMSLSKLQEMVKGRQAWHASVHGFPKSQTWLSNWTARYLSVKPNCKPRLFSDQKGLNIFTSHTSILMKLLEDKYILARRGVNQEIGKHEGQGTENPAERQRNSRSQESWTVMQPPSFQPQLRERETSWSPGDSRSGGDRAGGPGRLRHLKSLR